MWTRLLNFYVTLWCYLHGRQTDDVVQNEMAIMVVIVLICPGHCGIKFCPLKTYCKGGHKCVFKMIMRVIVLFCVGYCV